MEQLIREGLNALGLNTAKAPLLAEYGRLLLEKNQVMNLTAITQPSQVARLHMLDCAALLHCGEFQGACLIDVGTGAGFPGLVLKIMEPTLKLAVLDSLEKRLNWLAEVCNTLGIGGVQFIHARAEEQAHEAGFRECFDYATARAVAPMNTLCELCLPYVKVGGCFLAMKSVESDPELEAAASTFSKLGGQLDRLWDYDIPGTQVRHRVTVIGKYSATPSQFPRRWAKIQKKPL